MRNRNSEKEDLVKKKTVELLVTQGFENFSVNKLAKACGISIATLYIYYKDKDDLIINIAKEEVRKFRSAILSGFDPKAGFEDGLRIQWKNRYLYLLKDPVMTLFFEQLRSSSYQHGIYSGINDDFNETINRFMDNAVKRGEIARMPMEVYWSVAFSPLQSLLRAHYEGMRANGKAFLLTEEILWQTFALVLKALTQ